MLASLAVFVAAFTSLAAGQGLAQVPECARTCVGQSFGSCNTVDINCICGNDQLIADLSCCVSTACNTEEQQGVIAFANQLCSANGVTDLPTAAGCSSTPGATPTQTTAGETADLTTVTPGPAPVETTGAAVKNAAGLGAGAAMAGLMALL